MMYEAAATARDNEAAKPMSRIAYTPKEIAGRIGVKPTTVIAWIQRGKFPATRWEGRLYTTAKQLAAWIEQIELNPAYEMHPEIDVSPQFEDDFDPLDPREP